GPDRLRLTADRRARRPGPAGQPAPAGRRRQRPRFRPARHLRRPRPRPQPAGLAVPACGPVVGVPRRRGRARRVPRRETGAAPVTTVKRAAKAGGATPIALGAEAVHVPLLSPALMP